MNVMSVLLGVALVLGATAGMARGGEGGPNYGRWSKGPPADASFFPIAVWLQNPANAERYRDIGVNVYVGLWQGPTEAQLDALERVGMYVICDQNEVGLANRDRRIIIGWMHDDEPDNAQAEPEGGWGPPIPPETIQEDYERMRQVDPDRPVLLNLGQGVAWDGWYGRGVRTNKPEDYPHYIKGADIVSFDIYPAVHDHQDVAGHLWYVARGVQRLVEWSSDDQIVWNCIEASRIGNVNVKPTPHQIRAEVWMSLIHGSRGLIYFVHQFQPTFVEASLLEDEELSSAVKEINQQIHDLAPVLNSATVPDGVKVESSNGEVPIAAMVKRHGGATYLFAVAMRDGSTRASFALRDVPAQAVVERLGEEGTITARDGRFSDEFEGYAVRLYRIRD
jgi:hypothetical protein